MCRATRRPSLVIAVLVTLHAWLAGSAAAEALVLVDDGKSDYRIVVPRAPAPAVTHAADELAHHIEQMTGAALPIVDEDEPAGPRELYVGPVERARALVDDRPLDDEQYLLRSVDEHLVILGGSPRGTLYGVYGLLQDQLGVRWFTRDVSHVPQRQRLTLPELDERVRPAFDYRWTLIHDAYDADWAARNRLNGFNGLQARHGGGLRFVPRHESHTFYRLLPPDEHFDAHPEFYSLVDGRRLREGGQLCLTHEQVIDHITRRVRRLLAEHPDRQVISISQNDGNNNHCQCPRCAELEEREATAAAPLLHLVNAVAEAIEEEFPDRYVETLAYEWSRRPPRTMRARDNVIIRYSTLRASFAAPLGEMGSGNRAIVRDLAQWAQRSEHLWVWNYTTYFSYYLLPWPNYPVLDDNLRHFAELGVRGVFEQGNWQAADGELQPMRAYVLARLLWDPSLDGEMLIDEFLAGVYGEAAAPLRAYLDLLTDALRDTGARLRIYGGRTVDHLDHDVLAEADRLWDLAEQAVADAPGELQRVRHARLAVDYAIIERHRLHGSELLAYDGPWHRGRVVHIDPALVRRIERFLERARQAGLTHIREGEPDFDQYAQDLEALVDQQ
ncbi:MAG: DUF4838 domain-containing protein [Phycisphaeraceae bacterium]